MTDISEFTDDELSGIGIGPEHGIAKSRLNSLIAKTNVADALAIATDARDNHVMASCVGLAAQTDEDEVSAALDGVATKSFHPSEVVVKVTATTGTVAADGTINVGTSTGGSDILSAQALTGLDTVGDTRRIPLAEAQVAILGNATLYANVESEDTTVTTLVLSVFVIGRQF